MLFRSDDIATIWNQMFNGSLFYGRRGIVLNVISGIDLALWDLLGQVRQEPVGHPLGGKVPDELMFCATGPRPDLAKEMGFIGGKLPLMRAPCDGDAGLAATIADLAAMRDKVGPDFRLARDSWMSLDVGYAERLAP